MGEIERKKSMPPGRFPTTHWSVVQTANNNSDGPGHRALEELLKQYLPALKVHLCIARKIASDEADELLQGFIVCKVLEQELLGRVNPQRGRFRTFLLNVLDRYAIDQRRRRLTAERKFSSSHPDPDSLVASGPPAGTQFDLAWAKQLLEEAVVRTRRQLEESGRPELWQVLEFRVLTPIATATPAPPYEEMVSRFGFATATEACSAVLTARRTMVRVLREIVGEYAEADEIDEEIADLKRILASD